MPEKLIIIIAGCCICVEVIIIQRRIRWLGAIHRTFELEGLEEPLMAEAPLSAAIRTTHCRGAAHCRSSAHG